MHTAIIVDDIPNLGNDLKRVIESGYPEIKISAVCCNLDDAELAIRKYHPNLVFLDVQMESGKTSFDLLNKISPIDFEIIFTTAHNKYAIQAIKFSAIDYLLKPIEGVELKAAIERFKNKKSKIDSKKVESLLTAWTQPGNQQNKIHLPTKTGFDLITIADIVYCESNNYQTLMVLTGAREIVLNMTLRQCEDILTSYRFVRIHKSFLINLNHLKKYIKGKDGTAIVSNDINLTVSRNFKEKFIERLKTV